VADMKETPPVVELINVSKSYASPSGPAPVRVLEDVSLTVAQGESIAITGPSGSGKSTLLNMMGALDSPSSGVVRLAGTELDGLSDEKLADLRNREIGFVFQMHHLLPQCTVMENVLVPTLPHSPWRGDREAVERAHTLLDRVGLAGRLSHRPGQLSGGECQRVAVVRALINRPKLILADEPTGALDRATAEVLVQLLEELHIEYETTLVMATHSEELARRVGRSMALVDGRLVT
jgi:lipoprotein-releasing system ATP-binding protein